MNLGSDFDFVRDKGVKDVLQGAASVVPFGPIASGNDTGGTLGTCKISLAS